MLAYLLALTVGLGSFALYMAAFFFPEVHRKNDLIWSGVGLFYALVLWVCAARITGGVLLGQTASVTLLGWLGWQTLLLRRQVAPAEQQTAVPTSEELKTTVANLASPETVSKLVAQASQQAAKLKTWGQAKLKPAAQLTDPVSNQPANQASGKASSQAAEAPYVPLTPADFASADRAAAPEISIVDSTPISEPNELKPIVSEPVSSFKPVSNSKPVSSPQADKTPGKKSSEPKSSEPKSSEPKSSEPKSPNKATGGLGGAMQQMLGGVGKKRESKPVYVRKQFREPEPMAPIAAPLKTAEENLIAPIVAPLETTVETPTPIAESPSLPSDARLDTQLEAESADEADQFSSEPDPTSADAALQALPPHAPAPELVAAALLDAEEKHLPASPPEPDATEPKEAD